MIVCPVCDGEGYVYEEDGSGLDGCPRCAAVAESEWNRFGRESHDRLPLSTIVDGQLSGRHKTSDD